MTQKQVELRKREPEQSLIQEQNSLKNVLVDVERDLELNQNFFLGNNVDRGKIIPKREMRKNCNSKNYSTTKVKA